MLTKILNSSSRNYLIGLFLLGGLGAILAALPQVSPGYMDADYYFHVGVQLASGHGFSQQVIWNYLDLPSNLPTISHTYWMPLASILSAISMFLGRNTDFFTARLIFMVMTAFIPVITYFLTKMLCGCEKKSLLAGGLSLFSGFYFPYLSTTDTFPPLIVLGGAYFLCAARLLVKSPRNGELFLWGVICGLLHLSRVEGVLWLVGASIGWICTEISRYNSKAESHILKRIFWGLVCLAAGYVLIMGFWYFRNIQAFGAIFPPGNSKSLWITMYEDIFIFPPTQITPERWINQGLVPQVQARFDALVTNLQTFVAVQCVIILLPFFLVGFLQKFHVTWVKLAGFLWLAIFILMSLVFPFAGKYGGFFHAGAAFQPIIWGVSVIGIEKSVNYLIAWRNWKKTTQVHRFFVGMVVSVCCLLSLMAYIQKNLSRDDFAWNRSFLHYQSVENILAQHDPGGKGLVMVNNPPGYFVAGERAAIVIPFGDVGMLLAAAKFYNAKFIVLEDRNPVLLKPLYDRPFDYPEFRYLGDLEGTRLLEVNN